MKISTYIFSALLVALSVNSYGEGSLTPEAEDLKSKLEAWEAERKRELAEEIIKKREEVAQALQSHLQSATQGGDLDGALAIRNLIAHLSATETRAETGDSSVQMKAQDPTSLESRIVGSIWSWYVAAHKLQILADGKIHILREDGGKGNFLWEEVDDHTLLVLRENGDEFAIIEFDSRFRKATSKLKSGNTTPREIERVE